MRLATIATLSFLGTCGDLYEAPESGFVELKTEADNAKGFAIQLLPFETLFLFLEQLAHFSGIAHFSQPGYIINTGQDAARAKRHPGNHQFFYSIGISAGRVKYRNAAAGAVGDGDVVYSGTGSSHRHHGC